MTRVILTGVFYPGITLPMDPTNEAERRELIRAYKERPKPVGVFQVKNTVNGKVLLGSSLNLDGVLNQHRFMLSHGSHYLAALQKDWNQFGAAAFVFEILETVELKDDPDFDVKGELALLEEIWLEKLNPVGEGGYNRNARIRQ